MDRFGRNDSGDEFKEFSVDPEKVALLCLTLHNVRDGILGISKPYRQMEVPQDCWTPYWQWNLEIQDQSRAVLHSQIEFQHYSVKFAYIHEQPVSGNTSEGQLVRVQLDEQATRICLYPMPV